MEIKPLENVSIKDLHRAFCRAFSDYVEPVNLTVEQLQHILERRGFKDYLSFAAFADDEIVGFTLNASGQWNGKTTAYNTWTCPREAIDVHTGQPPKDISFRLLEGPDWKRLRSFWDFQPSWQNSVDSVKRVQSSVSLLGAFQHDVLVGYACMEEGTGDVPQFAVHPGFRRQGLATALLERITRLLDPPEIRFTNTCSESVPIKSFLLNLGLEPGHGQYEMILDL